MCFFKAITRNILLCDTEHVGYILQHKHRWNQSTENCALGGRAPVLSQRKGEYQERAHCTSRYRITHPLESREKVRHKQGCVREAPAEHLSLPISPRP